MRGCAGGLEEGAKIRYVLEPKIDGASVSLRYQDAHLVLAATRGRGNTGDDITANAKTIQAIPLKLKHKKNSPPPVLEVRGEVYMDNEDFQRVNQQLVAEGEEPYANARNTTAGTLRRLDPKMTAKRRLRFLTHGLGEVKPLPVDCYWDWLTLLREWNFPLPQETQRVDTIDEAIRVIHAFEKVRPTLPYMTDGMVLKVDDFAQRERLGSNSKSPRWIIAFKYETEQQPTVIHDVRWQVGKGGKITPVGDLEPVFIGGVTVVHVTLHNIDQIHRLGVHYGDTIIVERAGEVIPYVVEVDKGKRPNGAKPIEAPRKCPACHTPVEREALPDETAAYRCKNVDCDEFFRRHRVKLAKMPDDCPMCGKKVEVLDAGIDIYCPNPACPAQVKERLRWFCQRTQMDIEGLGDRLIDQLVEQKLVATFADLYRLTVDNIASLGSEVLQNEKTVKRTTGEKVATRIVENINGSKQRPLERVIAGLGIHHVGTRGAHVLATAFGSLDALKKATVETLAATNDVGDVTAESVHDFFHSEAGQKAVDDLQAVGVNPTQKVVEPEDIAALPLAGMSIVVTGTLPTMSRPEIEELITKLGGKPSGSVSKRTRFLIAGEEAGSKLAKAKDLGIEILTEAEFLKRAK